MLKEIFYNSLKMLEIYKELYGKRLEGLAGKSCFSHTNPSNFRRPMQSLLLRYCMRLKINRLLNFHMLFQFVLTKFFKSELLLY